MYSGYSFPTFDDLTVHLLRRINPARILDIGAGEGKYGRLIRGCGLSQAHLTAIEFEPQRRAQLLEIGYDEVRTMSATDLFKQSGESFEVVILGDVIEHFRKSEGQDLLEFLNYRSAYMLVITPECMPMSSANFYEGHNSLWRPEAMKWHDLWAHCRHGLMHFYLIRGYLGREAPGLQELAASANACDFLGSLDNPDRAWPIAKLDVHDAVSVDRLSEQGDGMRYRFF